MHKRFKSYTSNNKTSKRDEGVVVANGFRVLGICLKIIYIISTKVSLLHKQNLSTHTIYRAIETHCNILVC